MGRKAIDLTGKYYGYLHVLRSVKERKNGSVVWECYCEKCGETKQISGALLRKNETTSCGCDGTSLKGKGHGLKDIVGEVFGRLTVLERVYSKSYTKVAKWLCQCSCGTLIITRGSALRKGLTVSCGCYHKEIITTNLVGKRFGRLVAIEKLSRQSTNSSFYYSCKCDCGRHTEVRTGDLRGGVTRSCGCLASDTARKQMTKHGLSGTKEGKRTYLRNRKERGRNLDNRWTPLMELCLRNYQPACVVCGATEDLETDHVLPLSKGNGLYPGNSVILCAHHNRMKQAKALDQLPVEMATKIRDAAESFRVAWSGGF